MFFWSTAMYRSTARAEGKVVIITGANTGIGKETVRDLYRRGARVIMGVRTVSKGEAAKQEIEAEGKDEKGSIEVLPLDLMSLESVRSFAGEVSSKVGKVDVLINNAGIMACPRAETKEGFESQLGVNHLGHFLLTHLLLDKVRAAAPSRIVNLTSSAHNRGQMYFDDLQLKNGYAEWKAYSQSKLANILFTKELARRLEGTRVTTYAVHPGVVKTELFRHTSFLLRLVLYPFYKTPVQGAQTTLYCALAPELAEVTGRYYADCKETQPSNRAMNEEDAKRLWTVSEELVGIAK